MPFLRWNWYHLSISYHNQQYHPLVLSWDEANFSLTVCNRKHWIFERITLYGRNYHYSFFKSSFWGKLCYPQPQMKNYRGKQWKIVRGEFISCNSSVDNPRFWEALCSQCWATHLMFLSLFSEDCLTWHLRSFSV